MADPLSIIASVVGVAAAALQTSKGLYDLLETTRHSSDEIRIISRDAHAFYSVVSSLQQELLRQDVISEDEGLVRMVENLKPPLASCSAILGRIMVKIKGRIKPDKIGYKFSNFDVKWWFSMKNELQGLTMQLMAAKTTLDVALSSLSTLCNFRLLAMGNQAVPNPHGLGASFALRRYLDESVSGGSVVPSSPSSIPADVATLSFAEPESHELPATSENSVYYPPDVLASDPGPSGWTYVSDFPAPPSYYASIAPMTTMDLNPLPSITPLIAELCSGEIEALAATPSRPESGYSGTENPPAAAANSFSVPSTTMKTDDQFQLSTDKRSHHEALIVGETLPSNSRLSKTSDAAANSDSKPYTEMNHSFLQAIKADDREQVERMLAGGANVNTMTADGQTALHVALRLQSEDIARTLLRYGAHANITFQGRTPLLQAAAQRLHIFIPWLVAWDADVGAKDEDGRTALHLVYCVSIRTTKLLLKKGASVTSRTIAGWTPLHEVAVLEGSPIHFVEQVIPLLLSEGADIEAENEGMTPLHGAASHANDRILQAFIKQGADVNHGSADYPIHRAVWMGYVANVIALLDAGADIDSQERRYNNTPLHVAAIKGETSVIRLLLGRGANTEIRNGRFQTPLNLAVNNHGEDSKAAFELRNSTVAIVKPNQSRSSIPPRYLRPTSAREGSHGLHSSKSFSGTEKDRQTNLKRHMTAVHDQRTRASNSDHMGDQHRLTEELFTAAKVGDGQQIEWCLRNGADVNIRTINGQTALHLALQHNSGIGAVRLLQQGADPNDVQRITAGLDKHEQCRGWTPLMRAAEQGLIVVAKELFLHGAEIDVRDDEGRSALHIASRHYQLDMLRLLLEHNAPIMSRSKEAWTPLHEAAASKNLGPISNTIHQLLDRGADIEAVTSNATQGMTPLYLAVSRRNLAQTTFLIDRMANVNSLSGLGDWPIHRAVYVGDIDIVVLLTGAGAKIDKQDRQGNTPLHIAAIKGHVSIIQWLLHSRAARTILNNDALTALGEANVTHGDNSYISKAIQAERLERWTPV